MKNAAIVLIVLAMLSSCKTEPKQEAPKTDTELNELFAMMQGSFNSEAQAKADSTYYNISLHMYPIWKDQGNWLYVEQALNAMQDRPYRQRVYEVKRSSDSTIASYVYTLPNDSLWIGKWKTPEAFDALKQEDLSLRNGCEVVLMKKGDSFEGKTGNMSCESSLRGASFATSVVNIGKDKIESWDRGFDAEGHQVWGAEKGGYVFDKLN